MYVYGVCVWICKSHVCTGIVDSAGVVQTLSPCAWEWSRAEAGNVVMETRNYLRHQQFTVNNFYHRASTQAGRGTECLISVPVACHHNRQACNTLLGQAGNKFTHRPSIEMGHASSKVHLYVLYTFLFYLLEVQLFCWTFSLAASCLWTKIGQVSNRLINRNGNRFLRYTWFGSACCGSLFVLTSLLLAVFQTHAALTWHDIIITVCYPSVLSRVTVTSPDLQCSSLLSCIYRAGEWRHYRSDSKLGFTYNLNYTCNINNNWTYICMYAYV